MSDYINITVTPTGAAVILAGLRALQDDPSLTKDERTFVERMVSEISEGLIVTTPQTTEVKEVLH